MTGEPATAQPLSRGRLVAFAAVSVSLAACSFPLMAYLPARYAREFGLSLVAVGLIFSLARIGNSQRSAARPAQRSRRRLAHWEPAPGIAAFTRPPH